MHASRSRNRLGVGPVHLCTVIIAAAVFAITSGCIRQSTPPPEAELAGTWALQTQQTTNLTQLLLTFNDNGDLTKVTYQLAGVTIDANAPVASSSVTDDQVEIVAGFGVNHVIFSGTFNADRTQIVGVVTIRIVLPVITVTVDGGAATLVKQ